MAERKSLIELKAYGRCGDIYRWLREHYEQMLEERDELQRPWEVITAEIASAGVKGTRGGPPYVTSVRKTWKRVCRDVEAERERKEARKAEREARAARRPPPAIPPKKESRALVPRIAGNAAPAVYTGFTGGERRGYAGLSIDELVDRLWEKEGFTPWKDPDLLPEEAERLKTEYARSKRQALWRGMRGDGRLSREQRHELAIEFDLGYRKQFLADQEMRKERKNS